MRLYGSYGETCCEPTCWPQRRERHRLSGWDTRRQGAGRSAPLAEPSDLPASAGTGDAAGTDLSRRTDRVGRKIS